MAGHADKYEELREEQAGTGKAPPVSRGSARPPAPRVNVLGTGIAAMNPAGVATLIQRWVEDETFGRYVCVTGVHGVMEGFRDEQVRLAHNRADLCVPDGMPLVWISRLSGHRRTRRVYGPDLMLTLLALAEKEGYTNFFYGGGPGLVEKLRDRMLERFPALQIVGTHTPPFRRLSEEEKGKVIAKINAAEPDLLWVGLSTPKQELLMADFSACVRAKVMFGVGAAFDFNAGLLRQAPQWMQAAGMEWFFRLCAEPRRLWRRYARNNPSFLFHLLLQRLRLKSYPVHDAAPKNHGSTS